MSCEAVVHEFDQASRWDRESQPHGAAKVRFARAHLLETARNVTTRIHEGDSGSISFAGETGGLCQACYHRARELQHGRTRAAAEVEGAGRESGALDESRERARSISKTPSTIKKAQGSRHLKACISSGVTPPEGTQKLRGFYFLQAIFNKSADVLGAFLFPYFVAAAAFDLRLLLFRAAALPVG